MMQLIGDIISMLFISLSVIYMFVSLYKTRSIKAIYLVIVGVFFALVLIFSFHFIKPAIRIFIVIFMITLISYFFFSKNIKNAIIDAIFIEGICIIAETIYTSFYLIINKTENLMIWNRSPIGMIISNTIISIIMILLFKLKVTQKIYNKLQSYTNHLYKNQFVISILFFYIVAITLFYSVYYTYYSNRVILFVTISIVFLLYTIIFYAIMDTASKYENIKGKYSLSLENLKEYEEMLNQYRISNHENKNQLLLIRNMVNDSKTKKYIDEMIDNKEKDDHNVYNKLKKIPLVSIRAVIYSKVLLMGNKKIDYSINIDRKLTSKDFSDVSDNLSLDICNILNIFIDNAIDEAIKSSEKQILIEFNKVDDRIEVAISNTCFNEVRLEEIYGMGYTTKGNGHGFGLPIVKNIIDKHSSKLSNRVEKVNDIFIQYLYIKVK